MNVIRDEDFGGLMMFPLLQQWGINRCNVKNCNNKPTTIIAGLTKELPKIGMCEKHYLESKKAKKIHFSFDFN